MNAAEHVLAVGMSEVEACGLISRLQASPQIVTDPSAVPAGQQVSAILSAPSESTSIIAMAQAMQILDRVPQGLARVDAAGRILWHNARLLPMSTTADPLGKDLIEILGAPQILGPNCDPIRDALLGAGEAQSQLLADDDTYFQLEAAAIPPTAGSTDATVLVSIRDVSEEVLQQQKLDAIHQAGFALRDLTPETLLEMSVEQRVDYLKEQIVQFTQELLGFETIEIRMLDRRTKELQPLLNVGMTKDAATRKLYAQEAGNGVTGFVASTGKSYLCEDTTRDELYIEGAAHAKSSLTVPLCVHDEVLGTINVESFQPGWFDEQDQKFLEMFSREVATALNTLELLVAEKFSTAAAGTELLLRQVAQPVDEVLNDTTLILEKYIGHDPGVCERLRRILEHTRTIKHIIHRVGEEIAPKAPQAVSPAMQQRPKLRRKRILVADEDQTVRSAAHELLGKFGCEVETAHNGREAITMAKLSHYDVVIADIRLPDMNGFDCFVELRGNNEKLAVILMTGFGYDPGHCIVKARTHGLKSVLYKPFRLDQLLNELEKAVGE